VTFKTCEALAKDHEVTLFTTNVSVRGGWIPGRGTEGDLDVRRSPFTQAQFRTEYFPAQWPTRFAFSPKLGAALRDRIHDFDVVHIHGLYLYTSLAAARACLKANVPYLVQPHGCLDPRVIRHHHLRKAIYHSQVERPILDGAGAMHYASEEEMDLARPIGIRAPGVVVPHGVDLDYYLHRPRRGAFRKRHPGVADNKLVLFLGRITPKKGLDLLVSSFARVQAEQPGSRLVIAGPDDEGYGKQVRGYVAANRLEPFVIFTGMLEGQQKLEVLADADVWVLPSYTENFGIAVLEALACGLPTVISDQVNIHRELSRAGATLVTRCDVDEISQALLRILSSTDLATELGQAGRRLAADYTWERTAARLGSVYENLVNRPGTHVSAQRM
jgi:glycosyltransferase involved in cell wall biosynthesis